MVMGEAFFPGSDCCVLCGLSHRQIHVFSHAGRSEVRMSTKPWYSLSKVCSLFVDYLILVGLNCCGFMFVLVKLLTWSSWKGGVVWCDRFPNLILWMTVLISKWNMSRNEMKGCGREFIFLHCLFWLNLTVSKEDVNWACWKYYRSLFLLDKFWSLKVHFI